MRFYSDALVVVYHEKDNTYVVRVTPPSTEVHSVKVDKHPKVHGDVVVWAPYLEDLLHHVRLPGLAPTVPLPLPPERVVGVRSLVERMTGSAAGERQFGGRREKPIAHRDDCGRLDRVLEPLAPGLSPSSDEGPVSELTHGDGCQEDLIQPAV